MFPSTNPTTTPAWQALQLHHNLFEQVKMKDLFFNDEERFNKFSIQFEEILFDFSKNIITENTMAVLMELANECKLPDAIEAMFTGEKINGTEGRAVLHTALRNFSGKEVLQDGKDIMPQVQ